MALDRTRLDELVWVEALSDDQTREDAAMAELMAEATRDIDHLTAVLLDALRETNGAGNDASGYDAVLEAIRRAQPAAFARLLQLVPHEPALWDALYFLRIGDDSPISEIIDALGAATISRAWHNYERTKEDRSWWAIDVLHDLTVHDHDEGLHRELLLQLVSDADDETMWTLAAGPVEDFLQPEAANRDLIESRVSWIEEQARRDPKLRHVLTGVWVTSLRPDVAARVDAARLHVQN
ncbi:MAG: hypothetical protein HZB15_07360 [Actinobacteria bacterium]|nr:hypothetical protein [Actinomycetota bacterium]